MSTKAVEALRAERDEIVAICRTLRAEEWDAPSACAGWAVRDVIAHMASVLHGVVDPSRMPDISGGAEAAMEGPVAERRSWPVADVLDEYETYSEQAIGVVTMAQEPPLSETLLPMGDLGTHPMSMLASTFTFDAYCHLRNDLLAPHGPLDRPEPPRDELRLGATREWMLAGLPWMSQAQLGFLDRPVVLVLAGPGGGTFSIAPGGADGRVAVTEGRAPGAVATLSSTTHDFVRWATHRAPWHGLASVEGDTAYGARVLDAVHVF